MKPELETQFDGFLLHVFSHKAYALEFAHQSLGEIQALLLLGNVSIGDQTMVLSSRQDHIPCCPLRVAFEGYHSDIS